MKSKAIILLLAIVSVGSMGMTSQAFADHHEGQAVPLDFSTDSDTYDHSSLILMINDFASRSGVIEIIFALEIL